MDFQTCKQIAPAFNTEFRTTFKCWTGLIASASTTGKAEAFAMEVNLKITAAMKIAETKLMTEFSNTLDPFLEDLEDDESFERLVREGGSHRKDVPLKVIQELRKLLAHPIVQEAWPKFSPEDKSQIRKDCQRLAEVAAGMHM
jgi:hypothetical protein